MFDHIGITVKNLGASFRLPKGNTVEAVCWKEPA